MTRLSRKLAARPLRNDQAVTGMWSLKLPFVCMWMTSRSLYPRSVLRRYGTEYVLKLQSQNLGGCYLVAITDTLEFLVPIPNERPSRSLIGIGRIRFDNPVLSTRN